MFIRRKRGWELPESAAAPEDVFRNRRRLIKGAAAGSILLAGAGVLGVRWTRAAEVPVGAPEGDPTADLYPVPRNMRYRVSREITPEKTVATYNNYYEFGSSKTIWQKAQDLPIRPWTIEIDGEVEKRMTVDIDDLIGRMPLEERVYRHRCVEAWAITVPWSGFPMAKFVEFAKPLSAAKYVRMETFMDPDVAGGQRASWYPWPYVEGLTMAEATNELAMLVTGMYGKPAPKQNGSPIRLITPWKYGFKSIKGIVRFTFTRERPVNFWQEIQANEYGFWANVNPEVPHPRWSQAEEKLLPSRERVPTRIYNGYGEFVAHMYKDLKDEPLFM